MRRAFDILAIVMIGIFTVIACVGSYRSHTYSMQVRAAEIVPERITEVEYIEVEPIVIEVADEIADEVTEEPIVEKVPTVPMVKPDMQVIAEVVMSEAGNQPLVGKVAVAATLLNRMDDSGRAAISIALEAYSYPYYGIVTDECYKAVEIAMENRDLFPADMFYFRTLHYHDFGYPYCQIGDHYFSTRGEN